MPKQPNGLTGDCYDVSDRPIMVSLEYGQPDGKIMIETCEDMAWMLDRFDFLTNDIVIDYVEFRWHVE